MDGASSCMARSSRGSPTVAPSVLDDARQLLADGEYARAVEQVQLIASEVGRVGEDATLLIARSELRRNHPEAALGILRERDAWSLPSQTYADVLLGISEYRTGSRSGVDRIEHAYARANSPEERSEAAYYRAWASYVERDLACAEEWIQTSLDDAHDVHAARAHALMGWVEEAREEYSSSARAFRAALRSLRTSQERDVGLLAQVLQNLAVYAAELPDPRLADLVIEEWSRFKQAPEGVRSAVVQVAIHIGIAMTNVGRFDEAFDFWDDAEKLSHGVHTLAAASLLETADFFRLIDEPSAANRAVRRALEHLRVKVPREIEEQMPLLEAACVCARLDLPQSYGWILRYRELSKVDNGRWALTRDRRVQALELHARGLAEAVSGQRESGKGNIAAAAALWTELGYLRRAGYAAADLQSLGLRRDVAFNRFASIAPDHPLSLKRGKSANDANGPATWPHLSPALLKLLLDLCAGKSVREVARETGRSEFTLRNHLKRLFKIFQVTSSASLVAAAMRSQRTSRKKAAKNAG